MKLDRVFVSPLPVARRSLSPSTTPPERAPGRRHGNAVDGFDARPLEKRIGGRRRRLLKLIQAMATMQPRPRTAVPTPRTPRAADTFTPLPTTQATPAPVSPRCGTPNGGSSAPNPFLDGKGMSLNANGYQFAKAGPDMTWEQLARLFAERKVSANTSGSCGMTQAERSESLREFWDQCVASGKKPSECSFNLLCAPGAPPPGIVAG
ncbi:MAG: hypothetical protein Q8N26_32025 [Myxococcales bacterium]|nr:hypothetical protein [Myxococcales bacterium]